MNRVFSAGSLSRFVQWVDHVTATPVLGLDLGSAVIKAVELEERSGKLFLRRARIRELKQGENSFQAAQELLKEWGGSGKSVAMGLASPELVARSFHFPPMTNKELAQAVRFEAEQAILNGHSLDEMAVDWQLLSSSAKESIHGLLAVVPKQELSKRLEQARTAGLRPLVVDVGGLALWNAYWALVGSRETVRKTILLANLGAHSTNLVIAKEPDELILMRDLAMGAHEIGEGRQKDWETEITDSLVYARSKGGVRSLDSVYLTGGGSRALDLPQRIQPLLAAPVRLWNPLDELEYDSDCIEKSVGPLLPIAIGLALKRTL